MRIHTNNPGAVDAATRAAVAGLPGVALVSLEPRGSRSRASALELALSGSGRMGGQWGGGGYKSATWDEWGAVLGAAFAVDAETCRTRGDIYAAGMTAGHYESLEHFRWSTAGRYDEGMPDDAHAVHRWHFVGDAVTGAYFIHACKGCTAVRRQMARGRSFEEIQG